MTEKDGKIQGGIVVSQALQAYLFLGITNLISFYESDAP